MDPDSRVRLAEIGGDVKRIFDKFDQYTKDSERRDREHAAFTETVNARLNGHSERLRKVEDRVTVDQSERAGVGKAVRWAYIAIGSGIGTTAIGAAAMIARTFGV